MSAQWLTSLVRARQIQQDAAQQQLAEAERGVHSARARVRREAERLDALAAAAEETDVPAFVAAAVALQAAAATHAAARTAAQQADDHADSRRGALHEAAVAASSAEELQERAARAERERAARAAQRDLDEVAAGIHRRTSEVHR
jgi:flagellar export protein FliJ